MERISKWNKETLTTEAKKYKSKSEFKLRNSSAYNAALRLKILNDLFIDIRIQWNEDKVRKEASKYTSKSEFKKKCSSAYVWARKNKIINDLNFTPLIKIWDDKEIEQDVVKYKSKSQLSLENPKLYYALRTKGKLDDYFKNKNRKLTIDFLKNQASKYNSKYEFEKADGSSYQTLRKLNLLDSLFENLEGNSRNNVIYIYKIKNLSEKHNESVYKIGITSDHIGAERIEKTAKRNKWDIDIITINKTKTRATILESTILKIGSKIKISKKYDGFSEVRKMNKYQLDKCLSIIKDNCLEA